MLKLENLTKTYENGIKALQGITLDLPNKGLVAVVGSSGCGKSTLLNIMAGIDQKTNGRIIFNGKECNPYEIRQDNFACIYQDYKLIENLSVINNLLVAKELSTANFNDNDIDNLLKKLGVLECKNQKVLSLSGGQKQRVAIARALIQQPKVIFADEPTGNLDNENSNNIFALLTELSKDILVVVVTHDLDNVKKYANRLVRLSDGKILKTEVINDYATANIEEPQWIEPSNNKNKKLSAKAVFLMAIAFNKTKKGRRIAFMCISIVLLIVMVLSINWSMLRYGDMLFSSYKKYNASNMAVISYQCTDSLKLNSGGELEYNKFNDMAPIAEYLDTKKSIKTTKVYPSGIMPNIFNQTSNIASTYYAVDMKVLTMAQRAYYGSIEKFISATNCSEIGLKILQGREPNALNEVAIPKSKQIYFNSVGGYYDSKLNQYIPLSNEELFKHDWYGVKIVGVYEDNATIPKKFDEYPSIYGTYDQDMRANEIQANSYIKNNLLANTILISEDLAKAIDDTIYINGSADVKAWQGQYVGVSMKTGGQQVENVGFVPANAKTAFLTGVSSVNDGEIVLSASYATRNNIKDGDIVWLSSNLMRGELPRLAANNVVDKNFSANKKFVVKVNNDSNFSMFETVVCESDYKELIGDFNLGTFNIMANFNDFSRYDFNNVTAKARELFGKNSSSMNFPSVLEFEIDGASDLLEKYYDMSFYRDYFMIAIAVIISLAFGMLSYNTISILISSKAKDLLILKYLGAKKKDFFKIYGVFAFVQAVVELLIALGVGILLIFLINILITTRENLSMVFLPVISGAIYTVIAMSAVMVVISLFIGIIKINDKNLRKAFQKAKE